MSQDPDASPGPEHDRRTPLSRLRYGDVEVQTWRIIAAIVVVLAMLTLIGLALLHETSGRG